MLCGLAAAYANVGKMLLLKRNAARLNSAGIVLYFVLALTVAAPHRLYESGFVGGDVKELVVVQRH